MKKNIIIIFTIVLIAITARFLFASYGQIMQSLMKKKSRMPSVTISSVQEADIIKKFEAPGRIVSKYRVDVLARIQGYLVKSYFKEGDFVKKGQTLFQIEPQEWLYALQKAEANVANTKAQLLYAEKQLKRSEVLLKKDYISKSSYDELLSSRDSLKAQLSMYQAAVRDAQRNYGYTQVKAPVDGQVGIIAVTVGNFVNQSVGVLTTINSLNPIYVTFPVDSKEYLKLIKIDAENTKRKVELFFPTGDKYEFSGVQDFHNNQVDETTGTVTMRATFPNPHGHLINGEYVKVIVYANKPTNTPVIPQTAVLENPQGKYVYTLEGNIPKITQIKTSGQYKNNWIVESGLKKGDKIITGGLQKVIPQMPVKITEDSSSAVD
jgi:membrane fusion protein (multidrug efflux system)